MTDGIGTAGSEGYAGKLLVGACLVITRFSIGNLNPAVIISAGKYLHFPYLFLYKAITCGNILR